MMQPSDFGRLAARTNLREPSLSMAYRILVNGMSAAAAGRAYNRPRDVANRAAWRIRAEASKEKSCPECGRAY